MARRPTYVCRPCGYRTAKWLGRCPECDAWDSFVEPPVEGDRGSGATDVCAAAVRPYPEIEARDAPRGSTGLAELDRVLGGGLVPGSVSLIGGEPGIGKSTLLLQTASALAESGRPVLYASGEESAAQLRSRGDRLGAASAALLVAAETDVDALLQAARETAPSLLIVDSIQAVRCREIPSVPGSVTQVREAAARVVAYAKATATPVLLVGHVTKDGSIAGPRALEHVVDAVIQFEGDRSHEHRILRALKNRFGPVDELGVFKMTDGGLEEVPNPSALFLADRAEGLPGSVVMAAVQGTRPLLVEIQALVGEPGQGSPRRTAIGVDGNRLALILAVLQRSAGLELAGRDVFVNVTGGVTVSEPASDLAVACAVVSSVIGRPTARRAAVAGEIGLTGEVRAVSQVSARLRETARLGFELGVMPGQGDAREERLEVVRIRRVEEIFRRLFDAERDAAQIG